MKAIASRWRRRRRGRLPKDWWIPALLASLLVIAIVALAWDQDITGALAVLALFGVVPFLLGRNRARRAAGSDLPVERLSLLTWYLVASLAVLAIGLALSNNFSTPLHSPLAGASWPGFVSWLGPAWAGAAVLFLVATLGRLVHPRLGSFAFWWCRAAFVTGILSFGLGQVLVGINVHFDTSPSTPVTARVIELHPARSLKGRAVLELENWTTPGGPPIRVRFDVRIFRMDMDRRYASFQVRQGFLGHPYAVPPPGVR